MQRERKFRASRTSTLAGRVLSAWSAPPLRLSAGGRAPKPRWAPPTAHKRTRTPRRRLGTRGCNSSTEQAPHIVQHVADKKTVPDDEAEQRRDRRARRGDFRFERRSPDQPVERQHPEPDRDELLLDLEGAVDG